MLLTVGDRVIFTLHRYVFRELAKVFIMATLALTLVLSLGSILRPVQEYGIGPRQVVSLMACVLPVTLTFVLPIAALFASALVYGRFASDNEFDACKASGISILTLIYPGLALAVAVAIANLIFSFHVMPTFIHLAEKSFKANAKQILFRNIKRKGFYKFDSSQGGQSLIYADLANPQEDLLAGVVVVKLHGGDIERIDTAQTAKVIFNLGQRNEVRIIAHNTYRIGSVDEPGLTVEWLSANTEFGSLLADDIKFKKLDEMKKIRDVDLMLFNPIAELAYELHTQLVAELLAQDIAKKTRHQSDNYYRLHSGNKIIEFTTANCTPAKRGVIKLKDEIVAIESDVLTGETIRTIRCSQASIYVRERFPTTTLTMEFEEPAWQTQDGRKGTSATPLRIRGLITPMNVEKNADFFAEQNMLRPAEAAWKSLPAKLKPSPALKNLQNQLERKIQRTLAEIDAETHSRLVFGIGCISMIMIGIGLGIKLRGGHLLSAFGASCLPAALLMVCILMGKNIAKNVGSQVVSGTMIMWIGLAALSLFAIEIYRRLLKN
jgi:lipopolysaccharide export LptBFGC system permease protein LptF